MNICLLLCFLLFSALPKSITFFLSLFAMSSYSISLGSRAKILLLGSSMTQRSFSIEHQGWGNHLAHWYSRSADVLNRGAGGYNSRWLRQYLPQILMQGEKAPEMTVLFIGNNDAIEEGETQSVSVQEYKENLEAILKHLHAIKKNMIVLLITTTPVNEHLKPKHSNDRRRKYAEVVRSIVKDHERNLFDWTVRKTFDSATVSVDNHRPRYLGLVDLWGDFPTAVAIGDLHDGAHLNQDGNKKMFEALRRCINEHFPFFSPDYLVIPRNHLRARKFSFSQSNSSLIDTATGNHKTSLQRMSSSSDHATSNAIIDEWFVEPSLQLTLPPWHTLVADPSLPHEMSE